MEVHPSFFVLMQPSIFAFSQSYCLQLHWHRSLEEVPDTGPTVYILHEFFDALPVHHFVKTERGWCERLIDVAGPASPLHLQAVLSPRETPASKLAVQRRLEALPASESKVLFTNSFTNSKCSSALDIDVATSAVWIFSYTPWTGRVSFVHRASHLRPSLMGTTLLHAYQ